MNFVAIPKVLDHDINWDQGVNDWTNSLNRFEYWTTMGKAYWATGNSKYAQDFVYMLERWIAKNPPPAALQKRGVPDPAGWRTLEAGIRQHGSWYNAMQLFMGAPEFDDEATYQMTRSLVEQARFLRSWTETVKYRAGNWQVNESAGLATSGIMLPEFLEASHWRELGFQYLVAHMQQDVMPDGMHYELTPGYMGWVMEMYVNIAQLCRLNGYNVPGLLDRHKEMYRALLKLCKPNHCTPCPGDSPNVPVGDLLSVGALLYEEPDVRFYAADTPNADDLIWRLGADSLTRNMS